MPDPSERFRNLARGGRGYHYHRSEIANLILSSREPVVADVSKFLSDHLLGLEEKSWRVLSFASKDWQQLSRLRSNADEQVEADFLILAGFYATSNKASVRKLYEISRRTSDQFLTPDAPDPSAFVEEIGRLESQSIFALRMQCAAAYPATETMRDNVEKLIPTGWANARMVAPLVYHTAHAPSAALLDSFLSYLLAGDEEDVEKEVIKLLLNEDAVQDASLAFKIYLGLMCHPYDTLQFVLDHIEYQLANGHGVGSAQRAFLHTVASLFEDRRAKTLLRVLSDPISFEERPEVDELEAWFGIDRQTLAGYAAFCGLDRLDHNVQPGARRPYAILMNMRVQEVPEPSEFQSIVATHSLWAFTDAGRLIGALLRSIYMVNRTDREVESRDALRLICFMGCVTPFIASAPSAVQVLRNLQATVVTSGVDTPSIEERTGEALESNGPFPDRLWINDLQWKLRKLEEAGRIEEWLQFVSGNAKLRPYYLTGINWSWVEEIIATRRIKPFKSFAGVYLLLLMELETSPEPQRLRLALRPLIKDLSFEAAVDTMLDNFKEAAPALIRRSFTTKSILTTGFAQNHMAATAMRVSALEKAIQRLGFNALLTQEMYESEVKALTAELSLGHINAGKFEVPWESFRKDTSEMNGDLFLAVQALQPEEDTERMSALIEVPISFPGGRKETYKVRADKLASFHLVVSVIESYIQHPAFGLEVILSARFRHNNLVQEIWSAIADVDAATIPSEGGYAQRSLLDDYRPAVEQVVDAWCASRMQTKRPSKPEGMFDVVPEPKQMAQLVQDSTIADDLFGIIDKIIDWIRSTLRAQVEEAGLVFVDTLGAELRTMCEKIAAEQTTSDRYRTQDVERIRATVQDAIQRKLDDLRTWFGGIDDASAEAIHLEGLIVAVETIFDNVIPGRQVETEIEDGIGTIVFNQNEVKIAFDMVREIFTNALRHGSGRCVRLRISRCRDDPEMLWFSNDADGIETNESRIEGSRYDPSERIIADYGSGTAKIAAISANLCAKNVEVVRRTGNGSYALGVPLGTRTGADR